MGNFGPQLHDWRLDRPAQLWRCRHCAAELPNDPKGRAEAIKTRPCHEQQLEDAHDMLYRMRRRGPLSALLGAALVVGAPALGDPTPVRRR